MSEATPTADEIALLHDLVAIPSVNPGEREAVTYLCAEMARRDFRTHIDGIGTRSARSERARAHRAPRSY